MSLQLEDFLKVLGAETLHEGFVIVEGGVDDLAFAALQAEDLLFDGVFRDEFVGGDDVLLADTVATAAAIGLP